MKPYYPTITLLRGIAAMLVCFYHFTNYEDANGILLDDADILKQIGQLGIQGVFIFFVISGFVIPLSLVNESFELRDFHRFIYRRFVRIEIPYLFSILIYLLIAFLFSVYNQNNYELEGERILHHLIYTVPFTGFDWYNPIYWTLAIEFQFYIGIALLFPLFIHKNPWLRRSALFLFPLLALVLPDNRLLFHYAPLFSAGIFLLLYKTKREENWISLLGLAVSVALCIYVHGPVISLSVVATLFTIQFFSVENKLGKKLGSLSYSLYLTHGAVGGSLLYFTARHVESYPIKLLLITGAIIVSLFFAYLFWRFVEEPSQRYSKKIKIKL